MATVYIEYRARIPKTYAEEAQALLSFLREHRALGERGEFFVFHVVSDDGGGIRLGTLHHYLSRNTQIHGDTTRNNASILQKLIDGNRIELVQADAFCSGWGFEDNEPQDFEELAESIPTLILQEILAKRLAE